MNIGYACIILLSGFCIFLPNMIQAQDYITIAILAKDKAHCLPLYLTCIEQQTWPKNKTYIYIRTNNNNDNSAQILKDWIDRVGHEYADVYFDDADIDRPVQKYGQHEWNCERFKVLGKIRQDSITWACQKNSHYFVVDCDNFIKPHTLKKLFDLRLPVVAPFMVRQGSYYANFHAAVDANGYLAQSDLYYFVYDQKIKGLFELPVVHCAYLIRNEYLPYVCYDDYSWRYEYVIFSSILRQHGIPQYLDNRELYGYISFAENIEEIHESGIEPMVHAWFN